uniref:Ranatuerin-5 n=2 Tax=Aquarana catesbeiana TaxID=8400 RepID=TP5_AQUCT|nr:RecName: Full=Ranatuerin-5; AltName: Full=Temporin [Aquarana catesbeiana]
FLPIASLLGKYL